MEIIYGNNPVTEALKNGRRQINEIICAREKKDPILKLAQGIKVNFVQRKDLDQLCGHANHQGIAARCGGYPYASLDELLNLKSVIMLDSVEDPQNLGAIIRSAHALSSSGIIIPENRSAAVTPSAAKASAGASEHAKIAKVTNLRQAALTLKKAGFWLIGLDAAGQQPLSQVPEFDKLAIIMGGEDSGIRPVLAKELDILAHIPMQSDFNSLNVAQSAAIAIYELLARRS